MTDNPKPGSEAARNAAELGTDYAEIALDQVIKNWSDNEILRELPGIKTVLGIARGALSIRDYLFVKKIRRFIDSMDQHSKQEREDFAKDFEGDPKYRERVMDAVLLIIDQLDDTEKAVLFARAFTAFIRKEINFYEFNRYGQIIKAANVTHLQNLYGSINNETGSNRPIYTFVADQVLPLSSLGLVQLQNERPAVVTGMNPQPGKTVHYVSTDFGRRFIGIVVRKEDTEADD